jgi:uncharacterized protein YegJ (DUF2314 family)
MLRLLVIGVSAIVLFFPAYALLHPFLGEDWAAGVAIFLMYIGFPALMLRLWKTYPPLEAVPIEPNDPTMAEHVQRAKREFDRFKKGIQEGRKNAFVKYPVSTRDGTEHVWGIAHALNGDEVIVSLASTPVGNLADAESRDSRNSVPVAEIEDWLLVDNAGKCEGGYTNLALAKIYRRLHGKVPKKYLRDLECFVDIPPSELQSLA